MNNSKFKVEFTLKQHTPIIHFQSDQYGATLRATELKPKFDRFLIEKVFGGKDNKSNYEKYLIDKNALNYKIKINYPLEKYDDEIKSPLFFGNMGNDVKKKSKKYNETFKIEFQSLKYDCLIEKIKNYFPSFLATTNFGMRQTKGFGSFYLDNTSENFIAIDDALQGVYYLEINSREQTKIDETIKYFWTRFKSGINLNYNNQCNNPYEKSFSFEYLNNSKLNWDKRWIKETFFGIEKNNQESLFIRAYLGLGSTYTYKKTNEPCNKNKKLKIEDDYQIEVYSDTIKRVAAPLIFKPIVGANSTKIFMIPQLIHIPEDSKFYFIKRFNFIYSDFLKDGRPKFNKSLYPEIDISDNKSKEKQRKNLETFKNTKNKLLSNEFNYSAQFSRFESFLRDFCNKNNDDMHTPIKHQLKVPTNFNFNDMYSKYLISLGNNFNVQYSIPRQPIQTIPVQIKKVGAIL